MTTSIRQTITVPFSFPVVFTTDALNPENPALADIFAQAGPGPHLASVVLDAGLAACRPNLAHDFARYAASHDDAMRLAGPPLAVPGGEQAKAGLDVAHQVLERIFEHRLCRQSFLIVAGGGAVLDAAGFAASIAHRGVRLVRMPSTALAQNDAGVGVKNSVNFFGRKNFLGAFAPPFAVLNDFAFLACQPPESRRDGLAEAVKVALIRDRAFFSRLAALQDRLRRLEPRAVEEAVERCAVLHLEHIASSGDPFELGSSRPLDFGHWCAHALEERSAGRLSHGRAVAVGVAVDTVYSYLSGLLAKADMRSVLDLLAGLGFDLWLPELDGLDVDAAVESFREHLGGRLHLSLLTGLGSRIEVGQVDAGLMRQAMATLAPPGRS